jgi:hypothetical protein
MIIQLGFSLSLFYCNAGIWYRIGFMLASSYVKQVQSIEHARSKPNRHTRSGIRIFGEYTSSRNQYQSINQSINLIAKTSSQDFQPRFKTIANPRLQILLFLSPHSIFRILFSPFHHIHFYSSHCITPPDAVHNFFRKNYVTATYAHTRKCRAKRGRDFRHT